ncbi:MAG: hypothetical protein LLF96_12815, partial [Eubacteriales bacterium]|nr:hypothetical protein [Eubacteriales bacterium]
KQSGRMRAISSTAINHSAELTSLEDTVREALGVKTTLTGNERKGKITLTYNSAQELEHIYEIFGRLIG